MDSINNNNNEMMDIFHIKQVLTNMQVGFWTIELPHHGDPKMYGDAAIHTVLGVETDALTPETLYQYWIENIDPKYMEIVLQTVEALKHGISSEVKYLWQHPKKGWLWVRCGGYLDETYTEGFRFKGWHYDVTNELEPDFEESEHNIVAPQKLKLYSPYIIENIDELYEVDIANLTVHTILSKKNKYCEIKDGKNILFTIREQVHPDYIDLFNSMFKSAALQEIINENHPRQVECKIKTISGEYCWVDAKVFPAMIAGNVKLLLCIHDISDKKKVFDLTNEKNEILDAFYNVYSSIVEINLCTEQAYFLKSNIKELDQNILSIEQLYHAIIERFNISAEKDAMKHFLNIDNLKLIVEKQDSYNFDFPTRENDKTLTWKCIETLCIPKNKDKIYLTFCDVDEKHLINSILKHFVFSNSDYLYYVDLKNNSFLNFCKNDENVLLPPQHGDDYVKVMTNFNKKYVPLDEQDKVIRLMSPDYMAKRLQIEDSYTFEAGLIDDNGNYSRKQATIQSYDRENQTLFIIRKDVTKEYFKQKDQQQTLSMAQKMATTDPLTNLYNRKGACTEIEKRLLDIKDEMDAFIIIDLDNFKTVNDCLGHSQGDELLQKIAKTLEDNFRKTDIIARLGGDEFIIYMKDIKSRKTVVNAVEKLLSKLQLEYRWKNGNIQISVSAGIALVPFDGIHFQDLYINSDKALYNSKRQGKNRYSFFTMDEEF